MLFNSLIASSILLLAQLFEHLNPSKILDRYWIRLWMRRWDASRKFCSSFKLASSSEDNVQPLFFCLSTNLKRVLTSSSSLVRISIWCLILLKSSWINSLYHFVTQQMRQLNRLHLLLSLRRQEPRRGQPELHQKRLRIRWQFSSDMQVCYFKNIMH